MLAANTIVYFHMIVGFLCNLLSVDLVCVGARVWYLIYIFYLWKICLSDILILQVLEKAAAGKEIASVRG